MHLVKISIFHSFRILLKITIFITYASIFWSSWKSLSFASIPVEERPACITSWTVISLSRYPNLSNHTLLCCLTEKLSLLPLLLTFNPAVIPYVYTQNLISINVSKGKIQGLDKHFVNTTHSTPFRFYLKFSGSITCVSTFWSSWESVPPTLIPVLSTFTRTLILDQYIVLFLLNTWPNFNLHLLTWLGVVASYDKLPWVESVFTL